MANDTMIKGLDFTGQEFFIGIDVHKKSWKVTIRLNQMELRTFSMNPSPDELRNHMKRNYPKGKYYSVYEAGFCGYWIHRKLKKLGIENCIVNPADVPTTNKEKEQKSDPIDSRKLARELEKQSINGIYTVTPRQQSLRSLSRLRQQLVRRRIQEKNRIKGFLHFQGIKVPQRFDSNNWSSAFIHWLKKIDFEESLDQETLCFHITELEYQRKRMLVILSKIRALKKEIPEISYIQSVSGIGLITAFTIYAELVDINRFPNLDHLLSYLGLIPSIESSGEKEKVKGVTCRHNKHLRYLLIEAAWLGARNDPALTMSFENSVKRMSKQKAVIKIAKKLVNRIRYVWKNETYYQKLKVS